MKLDHALAQNVQAQKERDTFSIPMDRGPQFEMPKTEKDIFQDPQTHAKME